MGLIKTFRIVFVFSICILEQPAVMSFLCSFVIRFLFVCLIALNSAMLALFGGGATVHGQ